MVEGDKLVCVCEVLNLFITEPVKVVETEKQQNAAAIEMNQRPLIPPEVDKPEGSKNTSCKWKDVVGTIERNE